MTTEAEARKTLIDTSKNILNDVLDIIITAEATPGQPLDGDEIEIVVKKLFRVTQTLKTAQSLPLS